MGPQLSASTLRQGRTSFGPRAVPRHFKAHNIVCRVSFPKLLGGLLQRGNGSSSSKGRAASAQLLQLLEQAGGAAAPNAVSALVDELLEAGQGAAFKEQQLQGGPWVVVYTRGPLLWKAATSPGKLFNPKNEFSQDFDPTTRAVLNKGELLGQALFVTAAGTYAPSSRSSTAKGSSNNGSSQGSSGRKEGRASAPVTTPVPITASIQRGAVHVLGVQLPLPIRGSGKVDIAYLDTSVRVFRVPKSGSVTVQVRRDVLQRLLNAVQQ